MLSDIEVLKYLIMRTEIIMNLLFSDEINGTEMCLLLFGCLSVIRWHLLNLDY